MPEGSGALTSAPRSIASAVGVSPACIYKWLRRHKAQGMVGLRDRSSRPHRWRAQTLEAGEARIEALRRGRQPCT
ncbi:MAG: leucine zipper domain-containing protein [Methylocella sp.]